MYTTAATTSPATLPMNHFRCVSSMRNGHCPAFITLLYLLCLLTSGLLILCRCSRPPKNSSGFTRCAASCGQAYTQLGSSWPRQRSQEVAFTFTLAIVLPGYDRSSNWTGKGCILIFPYGQLFAHWPQPMHQSSMITSSELRRRIDPTGQPTMHSGSRHC